MVIGRIIGKTLNYQPISDDEARVRYSKFSGSPEETEAHVSLWRAIRQGRLATVTDCVERVLRRKPITLEEWAVENISAFRG
jgi:hypothetical protein